MIVLSQVELLVLLCATLLLQGNLFFENEKCLHFPDIQIKLKIKAELLPNEIFFYPAEALCRDRGFRALVGRDLAPGPDYVRRCLKCGRHPAASPFDF